LNQERPTRLPGVVLGGAYSSPRREASLCLGEPALSLHAWRSSDWENFAPSEVERTTFKSRRKIDPGVDSAQQDRVQQGQRCRPSLPARERTLSVLGRIIGSARGVRLAVEDTATIEPEGDLQTRRDLGHTEDPGDLKGPRPHGRLCYLYPSIRQGEDHRSSRQHFRGSPARQVRTSLTAKMSLNQDTSSPRSAHPSPIPATIPSRGDAGDGRGNKCAERAYRAARDGAHRLAAPRRRKPG